MSSLSGCLSNQIISEDFPEEFLNHRLIKILPDGYDICYIYKKHDDENDTIQITFYLFDSIKPLTNYDFNMVIGSINIYLDQEELDPDDESSANFTISNLDTNDKLEDFNLRRSGIGSYLLYLAILYAKCLNYDKIALDDMASFSDGFPRDNNIYTKAGFIYVEEDEPEMIGITENIYKNIDLFLNTKIKSLIDKLNELTLYFNDDEWDPVDDFNSDEDLYSDEDYMETD